MNLVKLLSRVWVGFVLFGLLIPLVDALAAVFIFVMGVVEVIGIALGPFGAFFGVFIGIALGAYAAYRVFKWIDGKMRAVAVNKLRKLGINIDAKGAGIFGHRYYTLLLPTPEVEEEFKRRFDELSTRYKAAVTAGFYYVALTTLVVIAFYLGNVFFTAISIDFLTQSNVAIPAMQWLAGLSIWLFLLGLASGYAYVSEEQKTVVLRRPETTAEEAKKTMKNITQGLLDLLFYPP